MLEALRPTPAVRVNRAFAVGRAPGAAEGLALLSGDGAVDAESSPYVHLVRGALLAELGDNAAAKTSLLTAHGVARNAAERAQIEARIGELDRNDE